MYNRPIAPIGGDVNHGIALRDVTIVTFTMALFMLVLRFSARLLIVKKTGADDWVMALATVVAAIQTAFVLKSVESGAGRHLFYLTQEQQLDTIKWNTLSQLPLVVSNCLLKISICLMIIRITNSKPLVKWMWVLIAALVLINGACFVDLLAQCRPIEALWNYSIKNACWDHKVLADLAWLQGGSCHFYFDLIFLYCKKNTKVSTNAVFSIVTDLICTSLPVIILWNIRITSKQKVAICGLMGLGLCTTACSIVRMVLYGTVSSFADSSFSLNTLEIWSVLEQNIGLIAANMPLIRAVHNFASEKMPKVYGSLKSLIGGGSHGSSQAHAFSGSYTEPSKLSESRAKEMATTKNPKSQYAHIDEMEVPLQKLPIMKTVDYYVAPLTETRDDQRREKWNSEQGLRDMV